MVNWLFRNSKTIFTFKKQVAIATCFLIISIFSFGQNNLVPNPSFEIITNCPNTAGQINLLDSWFQPNNNSSSDLFNSCASPGAFGVPKNYYGWQNAYSGIGYVGITLQGGSNFREYIEVKLNNTLKKGYTYCISLYVSLCDLSNYGTSRIGVYMSNDTIKSVCSYCLIPITPHIKNDSSLILTDTTNWVAISGNYIATGGEQYLTIGNFYDDATTLNDTVNIRKNGFNYSYYYIDNVSVYACDSPLVEEPQDTTFIFIPNVFSPNQDGENDLWEVTASKVSSLNIQVFNRWGEQVYSFNSAQLSTLDIQPSTSQLSTFNPAWDGYTPTGKPVPEGTYFYIIQYTLPSGETKVEKGYVTLVR